ncbi:MAG: amidohydrolase family protein [Candidatus Hydrogenedentota bacterium]
MSDKSITRRRFNIGVAAAVGAAMLGGRRADAAPKGKYFDIHTHLGQEWGNREPLGADGLLRWMDEMDIAQAAVLPLISPESWDHPISTDYVLKHTKAHRDRLIPFCSIDPRTINLGNYKIKLDLLKKYQDAGAKGFGEHKPGVAIDDSRNMELFKACAEVGFPVLFHLDNSRNTDKPGLPGLENMLRQIPDGVFIGHAQGWWASISGDTKQDTLQKYPDTKVFPGGAIDRLMDKYPNVYGDLSAGSGANAISRDIEFGAEFVKRRADRLLFGTDYLAPGQGVPQFELYGETLDHLPRKVKEKVFRGNARRLLGLG